MIDYVLPHALKISLATFGVCFTQHGHDVFASSDATCAVYRSGTSGKSSRIKPYIRILKRVGVPRGMTILVSSSIEVLSQHLSKKFQSFFQ